MDKQQRELDQAIKQTERNLGRVQHKIDEYNRQKDRYKNELRVQQEQMDMLVSPIKIEISEHAKVRFIERTGLLDMDKVCQQLIPDRILSQVRKRSGTGTFSTDKGAVIMKDYTVVTFITNPKQEY